MFDSQKVQRKKMIREIVFYVWFYHEKYKRKSNIIKIYIFYNYLIFI